MKTGSSLLLFVALGLTAGGAIAQQAKPQPAAAAQQQLSPEQQAQLARFEQQMAQAGDQVIGMVDEGKTGELWQGASEAAKKIVDGNAFVSQVAADRKRLGNVASRERVGVTYAAYKAGGEVPEGNYVSVVYATKFTGTQQPIRELVSFRLDEDKVWRVSGYSLR
ncbi:hypothetical protein CSC70_04760 [Pseudoxanthomonas kalamensis DSM 18571]|uniref:DUF4019 domain-containing protein n=1 Tax=Pseudoxanthomonas kalamensis TaxID=289483 RepID=UPI001391F2AC|nr:DUF4019 domain-containing protein [Pseudoxanthomonas kalamensis]KAF1711527.1 hypothetical protein CSC70_04760 [Pseudoxanthomonas kalamensis DSM 18571]